jgi:murein DD-endopeptidase MepM/ murein hydrolase activator NlpD
VNAPDDRYGILVVGGAHSAIRRFTVSRGALRLGAALLCVAGLVLAAGVLDYVRLRRDAVDVRALRVEAFERQQHLDALEIQLADVLAQLSRIEEFERKIRVIANLPGAQESERAPEVEAEAREDLDPIGVGGDEEPGAAPSPGQGPQASLAPQQPFSLVRAPSRPLAASDAIALESAPSGLASGPLARPRAALARAVAEGARQELSLSGLVDALRAQARRLAAMPSIRPARGWISSGFGLRISPFTGREQFHNGIDIAAPPGTPIVAPGRARVHWVGRKGPMGQAVVLDHGYGLRTTYGHLSEVFVHSGESVERGARIAAMGSSGRTTGSHVHYAVALDGRPLDPQHYILD